MLCLFKCVLLTLYGQLSVLLGLLSSSDTVSIVLKRLLYETHKPVVCSERGMQAGESYHSVAKSELMQQEKEMHHYGEVFLTSSQ